jgi:hypothetical protein
MPLNNLLQAFMPGLIPLGTNGFAWGDQPLLMPGQPMPGTVDETVRTMLVTPIRPKEGETAKRSLSEMFGHIKGLLTEAASPVPEYGSDEHRAIMAAFEAQVSPLEQQAVVDIAALFRAQALDWQERLERQTVPTKRVKAKDDEDSDEEWLALALLLMLGAYPGTEYGDWTLRFSSRLSSVLGNAFRAGSEQAARDLGIAVPPATLLSGNAWVRQRQADSAALITDTTWGQVQRALAAGIKLDETKEQLIARVTATIVTRAGTVSATIASTETLTAYNEGAMSVLEQSGIVEKIAWLTRYDSKVRDAHRRLHGQMIAPGARFIIPSGTHQGYSARGPGQFGVADLDIHCRCKIAVAKKTTT